MISFERVTRLVGLEPEDLRHWIEERWVLPDVGEHGYHFAEIDVARVRLIAELREELSVDDETLPVVLSLLDQVYDLRRQLKCVCDAVARQPADVRSAVLAEIEIQRGRGKL